MEAAIMLKVILFLLIVISELIYSDALCDETCMTESMKLTTPSMNRRDEVLLDASGDYMVVGIRGQNIRQKQRYVSSYYYGSYWQSYNVYERYAAVTIYENEHNSWVSTFDITGTYDLIDVAIRGNQMAVLSSNTTGAPISVSIFTRVNGIWGNETEFSLPPASYGYCCLEVQNGFLTLISSDYSSYPYYGYNRTMYVYTNIVGSWELSDGINVTSCGSYPSVAMYNPLIIVGCPYYNRSFGMVYVYKDGVEQAQISPPNGGRPWNFGWDVSIDGNTLVVGTRNYFANSEVFIYRVFKGIWTSEAKLSSSDTRYGDYFGYSVSIRGNYLLVGSKGSDTNGYNAGVAYGYRYINGKWIQHVKLISTESSSSNQYLGGDVAISNSHFIVSTGKTSCYNCHASVYIYRNILFNSKKHFESRKMLKPTIHNASTALYMNKDYLLIGVYKNIHVTYKRYYSYWYYYHYYKRYYYYSEQYGIRKYVDFNSYKYTNNTWTPCTEPNWHLKNVSAVAIYGNQMAMLTLNSTTNNGSNVISLFTHINNTWVNESVFSLPSDMVYNSLEIQNGYLITIGLPLETYSGKNISMYIYKRNLDSWKLQLNISLDYSCRNDAAVAIHGHFVITGCPAFNNSAGIVYIFKFDEYYWVNDEQLRPPNEKYNSYFGNALTTDGRFLIVGRYRYYSGVVYVYKRFNDKWIKETILKPSTGFVHDYFGCAVSLSGNNLVVGSNGNDENGYNSGAVYLFSYTSGTWMEEAKLISSDGSSNPYFGSTVAINDNHIVVGHSNITNPYANNMVYIYDLKEIVDDIQSNTNLTGIREIKPKIHKLQCNDINMTAYWIKSAFPVEGITRVAMLDSNCKDIVGGANKTMYWISLMHFSCGSIVNEDENNIIITSTVLMNVFMDYNRIITRGERSYRFNMECVYSRDLFVSMLNGYKPLNGINQIVHNKSSEGYFKASMDMYETSFFTQKLSYPIKVTLNEPMFVGVTIHQNANVKLIVEKCYATSTPTINGESYVFFVNKCPFDKTFQVIKSTGHQFYFSINAFQFIRTKEAVFLHCAIQICTENSTAHNCEQKCTNRHRRDVGYESTTPQNNIQYITSGRIMYAVKQTCKDISKDCPKYSVCVDTYPPICRCKNGYVFSVSDNTCEKKRIVSFKKLHLDKKWDDEFDDKSSQKFLQFAYTMERRLFRLFVLVLKILDIIGVKINDAHPGSVYVDFSLIYSVNSSKENVTKSVIDKLQNTNSVSNKEIQDLNIILDKLPTITNEEIEIPDTEDRSTLIIAVTVPIILLILIAVFIRMIYKPHKKKNVSVEPHVPNKVYLNEK